MGHGRGLQLGPFVGQHWALWAELCGVDWPVCDPGRSCHATRALLYLRLYVMRMGVCECVCVRAWVSECLLARMSLLQV